MHKKIKFLFFIIILFILPSFCFANVVINEVAWMGTTENWRYEWIELYANQNTPLDGWKIELYRNDLDFTIELSGTIEDYFLIVASDKIFTDYDFNYSNLGGKFNNNGQKVILKNSQGEIVNEIDYFSSGEGWSSGDNTTKQTMEKTETGWQTSADIGGTPKAQNSGSAPEPEPEPDLENKPEGTIIFEPAQINNPPTSDAGPDITAFAGQEILFDSYLSTDIDNDDLSFFWNFGDGATDTNQTSTHIYTIPGQYIATLSASDNEFTDLDIITINIYSKSIIISEFMPDPEGRDEQGEWIEIYNKSKQVANLTDWQLDDEEKGSKPFIFPKNSFIAPEQFLVLKRPITKLSLNNDEDEVRLIYPNGEIASQVKYSSKKIINQSVCFDGQNYYWTTMPTPGSANIISTDKISKQENLSSNNPKINIKTSQEPIHILAVNLTEPKKFSTQEKSQNIDSRVKPENDSAKNNLAIQTQSISDKIKGVSQYAPTNNSIPKKNYANLVLILSIIISGSLLASWGVVMVRK